MKIEWYGQAAFKITTDSGVKIITDPYTAGGMGLNYGEIADSADIVTVSHDHGDHSNVKAVGGNPEVVKDAATVKGVKITSVATAHDDAGGSQRGNNTVYCFEADEMKVCHLGDLGHMLNDEQLAGIGKVDVLLIPVGGNFTIDATVAADVADKISPKVIIPMHYSNERCPNFPVAGVDDFIKGKNNVNMADASEVEYKAGQLPVSATIVVLKPSR
jgi:L-ascorbate metabolism protein UlaG (beta-lactamase superfamily)